MHQLAAVTAGAHDLAVPREIIADYVASALLALACSWLDHGLGYTPEQIEAYFQQLVMPGVRAVLPSRAVP
jgi:hypothetical protein